MHRIALSIDIEDWYHNPAVIGSEFSKYKTVDDFRKDHDFEIDKFTGPFNRVIGILKEFNVKATFFIVADMARRFPWLVEKITGGGHEIACHGLYHYSKYDPHSGKMRFDAGRFEEMTAEARNILETLSGCKVEGYRAPCAYICGEMLDSLEKLGFKYDSSVAVNSLYKKTGGPTEGVTTVPYFPVKGGLSAGGGKRNIIEFPWPYYQVMGIRMPSAGGPFLRFFGARYISRGLKQSLSRGDTVLYFHAIDISDEKFPALGKNRPFYFAVKGKRVERRVRVLMEKFAERFCTCGSLLAKHM